MQLKKNPPTSVVSVRAKKETKTNLRTRKPKLPTNPDSIPPYRSRHRQIHLRTQAIPPIRQLELWVGFDFEPVIRDAASRPQDVRDTEHHRELGRRVLVRNLPQWRPDSRVQLAFVSVASGVGEVNWLMHALVV